MHRTSYVEKLNDRMVNTIAPQEKPFRVGDSIVQGLYLIVSPKGTKTWNWRGRVGGGRGRGPGKVKSVCLGRYPLYSLADAREWARGMTLSRDAGNDLLAGRLSSLAREQLRAERTCDWLFDLYMDNEGSARKSAHEKRRIYDRDVRSALGDKSIFDIEHDDIARLLQTKLATSPSGSNSIQSLLRRMFRWSVTSGRHLTGLTNDPARDIVKLAKLSSRDRNLNDYEISILFRALNIDKPKWAEPMLLCLYTGMRRSEAFNLEWSELDLEKGILALPGRRTKNGLDLILPLPTELVTMLRSRVSPLNRSKYVWPTFGKGDRPMSGFSKIVPALNLKMRELAVRDRRTIPPWSIHDLRRTVDTGMNGLHDENFHPLISSDVVERVVNHKLPGVRAVYNRWSYMAEKRAALRIWADHLRILWPPDMTLLQAPAPIDPDRTVAVESEPATAYSGAREGCGVDEVLVGQS